MSAVKCAARLRERFRRTSLAAVLAVAALAGATVPYAGLSRTAQAQSPAAAQAARATPEEIVRLVVESAGATYAGDCAAARSPQDTGKVCSRQVDEREGVRAYLIGRTFSEFSAWVFVEQTAAGWQAAGTAPLDFSSTRIEIPWPD
jgi:hypothetical protein